MCSWHKQLPHVIGIGPQWATTNVRQKATVVCEVRGSQSTKRRCTQCTTLSTDLEKRVNSDANYYFREYATDLRETVRIGSCPGADDCCEMGL